MPMTVNGFGTSVCGSRGNVGWGSFDAMEWFVAAFLPIIPIKAVHTFDWNGEQYRMIPIRWSLELVLRTFFGRWLWGIGAIGLLLFIIGIADMQGSGLGLLIAGLCLLVLAIVIGVVLSLSDRRNKNIRLVLGTTIGNADPFHLPRRMLEEMQADTQVAYGASSYAKAAQKLLAAGAFARAMWCARMTAALEDAHGGESLTNEILADPDVQEAIAVVRRKPGEWGSEMLLPDESDDSTDHHENVEALPIVKDLPDKRKRDDRVRGE